MLTIFDLYAILECYRTDCFSTMWMSVCVSRASQSGHLVLEREDKMSLRESRTGSLVSELSLLNNQLNSWRIIYDSAEPKRGKRQLNRSLPGVATDT